MTPSEFDEIPSWLTDDEEVAPCPCGMPPTEDVAFIIGPHQLARWIHEDCFHLLVPEVEERD